MARVASCPQCEHDLLVPDDAAPSALVKCPQCRAFFELQHAAARELPPALIVDSSPLPELTELPELAQEVPPVESASTTVTDFSSLATLSLDPETGPEADIRRNADDVETEEFKIADEFEFAENVLDEPLPAEVEEPAPRIAGFDLSAEQAQPEPVETPEEAAKRIDAWFRSAKTLSDVPALDLSAPEPAPEVEMELTAPVEAAEEETVDFSASDSPVADLSADLELDAPVESMESSEETAPWDDSQHMDRLLADLEGEAVDTYEPTEPYEPVAYDEAPVHEELVHEEAEEHFHPAAEWTPDESIAIPASPGQPERKRSIVRTLAVSAFGGIFGLGLGYYALLWLGPMLNRGKDIDFLEVAQYLPKSMLPAVFSEEKKPFKAAQPSHMADDLAAAGSVAKSDAAAPDEPVAPPMEEKPAADVPATDTTASTPTPPAEKTASFTGPAEPLKKPADADDRYALPAAKQDTPVREPAPLDAPPATAITESAPKPEPIHIRNAPVFSPANVDASLTAANAAEAGLVTGNLQDSKEIARTKGASYMAISDFAEKATFADVADAAKAEQQADEFFKKLLANAHAREEIAQIAPRWLAHPKRPQNGVFVAGNVKHVDTIGSLAEYTVELPGGASVVVVAPTGPPTNAAGPQGVIGVYGAIVDKPTDAIPGYSGKNSQVIFAKRLLSLE